MKHYEFTLVLRNVDEVTPGLEDQLYEAGCDDALIHFRSGAVYLDFDRQASSLEDAVLSAIKQVESAPVGAIVIHVAPEDYVTESDIAKRLHLKRQAVSLWIKGARRKSQPFPKPVMRLADKSPYWRWHEIIHWLHANHLVEHSELLDNAIFMSNINAVLEQRHSSGQKKRDLLKQKLIRKR